MFDVAALKAFVGPLAWFMKLGKSDTAQVRNEIAELLQHTGESIRTLTDVEELLASVKEADFDRNSFWQLYIHCSQVYTGGAAIDKARTHCTDIERDLKRLTFKVAQTMRTEIGSWKSVDQAFDVLTNADKRFLSEFGGALARLDRELRAIWEMLPEDPNADRRSAWRRFEALRLEVRGDVDSLRIVTDQLKAADTHVRLMLT
jgi:hypothetical protein